MKQICKNCEYWFGPNFECEHPNGPNGGGKARPEIGCSLWSSNGTDATEDKKYCPLLLTTPHSYCEGEKCGWWNAYVNCCAIAAMPAAIGDNSFGIMEDQNLNTAVKYTITFAKNHGISVAEAISHPTVQARFRVYYETGY